jgi:hypothetical protein
MVSKWSEFIHQWGGLHNFLIGGEITAAFHFDLPSLEELVEEVRQNEHTLFRTGQKRNKFDLTEFKEAKTMPLDVLFQRTFVIAHFTILEHMTGKGQVFEGIEEKWVQPWCKALAVRGFSWDKLFPILFISGRHSATQYHMDRTHQLAWQRIGTKHFFGLKDPDRWTTRELRCRCDLEEMNKPEGITDADTYRIVQPPDTMLWNAVGTPHWVETFDQPAVTMTLVHTGLRLNGKLCPHGDEQFAYYADPEPAAKKPVQKEHAAAAS